MLAFDTFARTPAIATDFESPHREATFAVPYDVVNKHEVTSVGYNVPMEEIISHKLANDPEIRDTQDAFFIVDLGCVTRKFNLWKEHLPRVTPFYAIKCNPNTAIIKTLHSLGAGFDCASKSEIAQVLGCGVPPEKIIYANPTKMKSHIAFAKSNAVDLMTFDNKEELFKISEVFPKARVVLRIITDDSNSLCRFSTKFGAPIEDCPELIRYAKELDLDLVGISFHVGSGCLSVASFESSIRNAFYLFKMAEEIGFNLHLLDLGGGWPGSDLPDEQHDDGKFHITFSEIADAVRILLDELFPPESGVTLIAEPGRYFVAESHTLVVNVFAKRHSKNDSGNFLYYINDGVYGSFNCIFFDHCTPKPQLVNAKDRTELYKCTLFGPTCDSIDCVAKDIELPELEVGDWLFFKNMGAYTVAAASNFNGFKSCPILCYVETPVI